jgi:hypothetical protein
MDPRLDTLTAVYRRSAIDGVTMRRVLVTLFIFAAAISTGAFEPAIKNSCDLLSKAEVEAVMGVPMRNPETQIFGMCEYKSVADHPYKAVHLSLERVESRQEWEKHERGIDPDVKAIVVPGIGDAALLWNRVLDARLSVIKGNTALSMMIDVGKMMPKTADTLPVALRLGQIAVPRMP